MPAVTGVVAHAGHRDLTMREVLGWWTWEPFVISGDGIGGDLGYPSTVERADGTFLTVWYEKMKDAPRAVLRQARWRLA